MKLLLLLMMLGATSALALDKVVKPWSFAALKRPAIPPVQNTTWVRDDIDRFVLAYQAAKRLTPNADAPRAMLIRRATLDLHGLLPTMQEVEDFERDPASDDQAFAKVVDRLLQSPRFGEKWARHWLDVVRYADSTGRSWNAPLIYAFRYRDYVIDALNTDKPYTRFMAEQIAGDALPAKTDAEKHQNLIATGFLQLGSMDLTALSQEQFVMDRVDDQIDVTTRSFLGLTIACARCHNHKTDPVTQEDYYALAGLFYSTQNWPGTANKTDMGSNLYVDPDRLLALPAAQASFSTKKPASKQVDRSDMMQDTMTGNGKRGPVKYVYDAALAMAATDSNIQNCPVRIAGNPNDEGKTPHRGDLKIPGLPPLPRIGERESGRFQLAQWLCSPTHPLTSRVMANRIWAQLFGKGLVNTVDNFGITGEKPVHPELLDHIAVRFVENGWSVKKLIRALMLSHTYRQSSQVGSGKLEVGSDFPQTAATTTSHLALPTSDFQNVDPANDCFWRMMPRRMTWETLRDSLLQVGGELSFDKPEGIQVAGNGGKGNTGRTRSLLDLEQPYRTIYLPVLRDLLPDTYATWDFPNPSQIQGRREVTTVASQALFMMNDRFVERTAEALAAKALETGKNNKERLKMIYRTLFGRYSESDELDQATALLASLEEGEEHRWSTLVQAMLGSSEFRYIW